MTPHRSEYILLYMNQNLIELDAQTAERLDRVAPGSARRRSEFIRAAIRKALWDVEERATEEAYARQPDTPDNAYLDPRVWEPPAKGRRRPTRSR